MPRRVEQPSKITETLRTLDGCAPVTGFMNWDAAGEQRDDAVWVYGPLGGVVICPAMTPPPTTPLDVVDFWVTDGWARGWPSRDQGKRWFNGGPALDADITTRFGPLVAHALAGGLQQWAHSAQASPQSRLALVLALDQFTRHVHRGSAQAFSGDARAQALVQHSLATGADRSLPWVARVFTYMPLMHAEDLALQDECVARFAQLSQDVPLALKERLASNLDFAQKHRQIIAQFGRFPHRNAVLGRTNTADEKDFLVNGPRFGQ